MRPDIAVTLCGQMTLSYGLGKAVYGSACALQTTGLPLRIFNLPELDTSMSPLGDVRMSENAAFSSHKGKRLAILHMNPDTMPAWFFSRSAPSPLQDLLDRHTYTIGYWAWEAQNGIPDFWRPLLPHVNEIWVPSQYTANAVSAHVPVPVTAMPHAVAPASARFSRQDFNIADTTFCFLFMFDAYSNLIRKNPEGLLKAYIAAFPKVSSRVALILKAKNLNTEQLGQLGKAAAQRRDIHIINRTLSVEENDSLMAACDCYVSLHRAEGFGLTMAEAMALGKPVIATGASGNLDFMSEDSAYLVPARPVRLNRKDGYYAAGTVWSDPDIGRACAVLKHIVGNRTEAETKGNRAARWIQQHLSHEAVGMKMKQRLISICSEWPLPDRQISAVE